MTYLSMKLEKSKYLIFKIIIELTMSPVSNNFTKVC